MSRRYDSSTTTFSPEGRIHQVEYAMESINNAGTCVGLLSEEGVVLAAEKRTLSKLLAPNQRSEKTVLLDDHCVALLAGLTSDANTLVNNIRVNSQRYLYRYQEAMPIEELVRNVCNYKQSYTQFGGLRPFGVAFLFAGWDCHHGYQLYQSDPSGNYSGWKATVIGQNNQAGKSLLKTDFKEDAKLEDNIKLAVKIMLKTMDSATPSAEKIELSTLKRTADGTIEFVSLDDEPLQKLIDDIKEAEEAEAKRAEASAANI